MMFRGCALLLIGLLGGCVQVLGLEELSSDEADAAIPDAMQPATPMDAEPMASCTPGASCDTGSPCEVGEVQCVDGDEVCVAVGVASADVMCRPAAGPCDVADYCDGESTACPADVLAFTGAECRVGDETGSCTGLSADCVLGCAAGTPCDTGRACELGEIDCATGAPQCVAVGVKAQGTACRVKNGDCDVAEVCDGVGATCPEDGFAGSEVTCRVAAGGCDVADTCDGSGPGCPANELRDEGVVCRGTGGLQCDVAEQCDGSSPFCPDDEVHPSSHVCRNANGVCDLADTCDGASKQCPGDDLRPSSHVCRAADGECDKEERCTGTSKACPQDGAQPSNHVCREASGVCDAAETCNGTSKSCPADQDAPNGTPCGPSNGCFVRSCFSGSCLQTDSCDIGEHCCGVDGCQPDHLECR